MILVSSLLEVNNDSSVMKRLLRSLPLDILKSNLVSIYKKYKKLYGKDYTMEALKHVYLIFINFFYL